MSADPLERPLRADARRNRERVLEVARGAFAAEGLAVSVDEIAHRAGVGVGTIYRHFPTKEALWAGIVAAGLDAMIAEAEDLAGASDPGGAFLGFLRAMADHAASDIALANAFSDAGFDVRPALADCKARLAAAIGVLLSRAQAVGAIRGDVGSGDVLALMAGTCVAGERHARDPAGGRRVLEVVLDGLRAQPPAPVPATERG